MPTIWEKLEAVEHFNALAAIFPQFMTVFPSLRALTSLVFDRTFTGAGTPHIIIYGLGRTCLEDLTEILFLAENDYGYAAVKLLRGLYERAVGTRRNPLLDTLV